jgi:alkanesulfonate monooxygenase SsuD/methylene tetrahydromethanopterin reductase-like flavin-dependent oxidoreductase (luciferase family)
VGGAGAKRTPALAARFAAEFNLAFQPLDAFTAACDRVRAACEAIGRDPGSMVYSAAQTVCCGADEAEFLRRAAAIGRDPEEIRRVGAAGTADEVAERLRAYRDAGADRMYLQVLDLTDLDHLRLVAEAVVPRLT